MKEIQLTYHLPDDMDEAEFVKAVNNFISSEFGEVKGTDEHSQKFVEAGQSFDCFSIPVREYRPSHQTATDGAINELMREQNLSREEVVIEMEKVSLGRS